VWWYGHVFLVTRWLRYLLYVSMLGDLLCVKICNFFYSALYNFSICWCNILKLWLSYLLIAVVVFISFSYRFIKLVLILVDYPIYLSVKRNLFITLSCCRKTWIVLKKAACSWRLTCCGVWCTVFSGNGWWELDGTLLYAWFSKRNIYYAVFSFWDVLIQNICSNAIQSCIVALLLCAFYVL